jgi:hypothetical protein
MTRGRWRTSGGFLICEPRSAGRMSVAIHEAAHAVAAHRLGVRVLKIEVFERRRGDHVEQCGRTTAEYDTRHGRIDPFIRAVVGLSGHEAEALMCGRPLSLLPLDDVRALERLGIGARSLDIVGSRCVREFVRRWARDIRRVARVLVVRRTLGRRGFLAALRGAA